MGTPMQKLSLLFCLLSLPNRVTCNDTRYLLFGGGGGGGFLEPLDVPGREGSGGGDSSGLASLPVAFAPTALPAACFVSCFLASQLGVKPCPHGHGLSSLCLTSSTSVMRPNLPAGTWLIVLGFDVAADAVGFFTALGSIRVAAAADQEVLLALVGCDESAEDDEEESTGADAAAGAAAVFLMLPSLPSPARL